MRSDEQRRKRQGETLSDAEKECLRSALKDEKKLKSQLLLSLRGELTDQFLPWIDACVVLAGEGKTDVPLLGTGGNEGSMDFSINHLIHLKDLIDPFTGQPTELAKFTIDHSLFGVLGVISSHGKPGFLNPGVANGPNMSSEFEGEAGDNPWNMVFMLEGAVLFAAAVTKKSGTAAGTFASFPFIFETSHAGHGAIGSKENSNSEFWAPIWKSFASVNELQALLSEGRNTVERRVVKNGLDMAKSVNSLGVDRGVFAFERYGFFERRGKGYSVSVPMGRFIVGDNATSRLVDELNGWLSTLQIFTRNKNVTKRFVDLQRMLEEKLFVLASRCPVPADVQGVLALLGKLQAALSHSGNAREKLRPVPQLSCRWVQAADDNTSVFRIARALAGLRGIEDQPLPLRSQLFPIHHLGHNEWLEKARKIERHENDPACRIRLYIPAQRDLVSTLITLLQMRLSLPARLDFADKPLNGNSGVDLADLMEFLTNTRMDSIISTLLPGLALCRFPDNDDRSAGKGGIHAAFALCKLAVTPDKTLRNLGVLQEKKGLPVAHQLLPKLASGDSVQTKQAIEIVWRRLRSSGLDPVMPLNQLPDLAGIDPRRLAAALLIPLNYGATGALARAVLNTGNDAQAESF